MLNRPTTSVTVQIFKYTDRPLIIEIENKRVTSDNGVAVYKQGPHQNNVMHVFAAWGEQVLTDPIPRRFDFAFYFHKIIIKYLKTHKLFTSTNHPAHHTLKSAQLTRG